MAFSCSPANKNPLSTRVPENQLKAFSLSCVSGEIVCGEGGSEGERSQAGPKEHLHVCRPTTLGPLLVCIRGPSLSGQTHCRQDQCAAHGKTMSVHPREKSSALDERKEAKGSWRR